MSMLTLPRALGHKGKPIYRGLRTNSLRDGHWSWWAEDRYYAEQYGEEVIRGRLLPTAPILDLVALILPDGDLSAADLNARMPGLAAALGLEDDAQVECDRLWDVAGEDLSLLADLLEANGYAGMRWLEWDRRVAFLLLH